MMRFTSTMLARRIGAAVLCTSLSACAAKEIPADWKPECVGRMALSLPGEAAVAGYSFKKLSQAIDMLPPQQWFQFEDGQNAGWSHTGYSGVVFVSNPITSEEYAALGVGIKKRLEISRLAAKENRRDDGSALTFATINTGSKTGVAWHISEYHTAFIKLGSHAFFWDIGGGRDSEKGNREILNTILNGLSYRASHTIPNDIGVCLPYAFIKDNGTQHRRISMTYRLKSHPDVTIWLEDVTAADYVEANDIKNAQPAARHNDFWGQYGRGDRQVDTIWKLPAVRPVTLDGREGLASFVEITHLEQPAKESAFGPKSEYRPKSTDYGYLAVVRGDPKAKQDTPDLRLYVIREAAHAKAKGIEPISEKAFLEMAQTIAASVKHRVTQ